MTDENEHTEPKQSILPNGKTLTTIPATKQSVQNAVKLHQKRTARVAAYCRVSTEEIDQQNSFENQTKYYRELIEQTDGWTLAGIYADDGISGMSLKGRKEFARMIADARAGKFDYIITKSISRFARNLIDGLNTVNELRTLDPAVGVYFEKENLDSLEKNSELTLTVLMTLAQSESDSTGENIQWTYRKKFQEGNPLINPNNIYGYQEGENGKWEINEGEAKVIREIYAYAIEGKGMQTIANILTREHHLSPRGHKEWYDGTVRSILTNEKYKGDVRMQKYVTIDRKSKHSKKNTGEATTYYLKDHHPAIVTREQWEFVQKILQELTPGNQKRKVKRNKTLVSILYCGSCGKPIRYWKRLRKAAGYTDEGLKSADNTGEKGTYYFQTPVYACPDYDFGHGRYRFVIEQSFMEMLYLLKADHEKYGDSCGFGQDYQRVIENVDVAEEKRMEEIYFSFVRMISSLPETNKGGQKLIVFGRDCNSTYFRESSGNVMPHRFNDVVSGRRKITSDIVDVAPDILEYKEEYFRDYFLRGDVLNDRIIFKTYFGIQVISKGIDRSLEAFAGYRKYNDDKTVRLAMRPYELLDVAPKFRTSKHSYADQSEQTI